MIVDHYAYIIESNTTPYTWGFTATVQPGDVVFMVTWYYAGVANANATTVTGLGATWTRTQIDAVAPAPAWHLGTGATTDGDITLSPHLYRGGVSAWLLRGVDTGTLSVANSTGTTGPLMVPAAGDHVMGVGIDNANLNLTLTYLPASGWTDRGYLAGARSSYVTADRTATVSEDHRLSVSGTGRVVMATITPTAPTGDSLGYHGATAITGAHVGATALSGAYVGSTQIYQP